MSFKSPANGVLDPELDGGHQLVGLDLLVGDFPLLVDAPVADLPLLVPGLGDALDVLAGSSYRVKKVR